MKWQRRTRNLGCSIVLHENYSLMSTRNPACSFRPRHDTAKPKKGRPEYRAIVTCSIEHKPPLLTLELKRDRRAVALSQMADLNYQRKIIVYHGCDTGVVAKVLSDEDALTPSERDYDWLGNGIYFWEHGPQRAYDWAKDEKTRAPHKIRTPAILGGYRNLSQIIDLLDTANTKLFEQMYPEFCRFILESGKPLPKNEPVPGTREPDRVLRKLDCAVVNWSLDELAKAGRNYQTVRGVFVEGKSAYPEGGIMLKSHIQIAVRDHRCIIGCFRPNPSSYLVGD